jgi:hypothetical protein
MEKFAVIKRIGNMSPHFDESFDSEESAIAYVNALRSKKDQQWEYSIYQLCEEL